MRKLKQGNAYRFELIVLDSNNEPMIVSDAMNVRYVMVDSRAATTTYISKSLSDPDVEISTDVVGLITVKLTNNDTKDLPITNLYHEVSFCDSVGNLTTLLAEDIEIIDVNIVNC